eukprot:scaffold664225_cov47-Prasinocladus_malaysianus.AAC.1
MPTHICRHNLMGVPSKLAWVLMAFMTLIPLSMTDDGSGGSDESFTPYVRYEYDNGMVGSLPNATADPHPQDYGTQGFAATKLQPLPDEVSNSRTDRLDVSESVK